MKKNNYKSSAPSLDFYYNQSTLVSECSYATHCHNAYEILFLLSGTATILTEGRTYPVKKYDLVITRPMSFHSIDIYGSQKYNRINILVNSSKQLVRLLNALSHNLEVINCENIPTIIDCFKKMETYNKHFPIEDFNVLLNNLLVEVCYNLLMRESVIEQEFSTSSKTITDALEYINKNLFDIKDVTDVCRHLYVSETHLFRLFKQEVRTSPKKYITTKRLLYAQKLLSEGEKPTAIFNKCGFNNYISFYQRYLDFFGYPPSDEPVKP